MSPPTGTSWTRLRSAHGTGCPEISGHPVPEELNTTSEIITLHAAADETYDALRQQGLRVPGLIRLAVEKNQTDARAELIEHMRRIEESARRLRDMLDEPARVEHESSALTVGEWT